MKRMIWIVMASVVGVSFHAARGQVVATGGTVTNYVENGTNFTAHIFTTVGTTNLNVAVGGNVEVLVVGGGGGGGKGYYGGGGGAGGLIYSKAFAVEAGSNYTVMVGDGGTGATVDTSDGGNGFSSQFGETLVAYGGGGGASRKSGAAANGGSGGGGSMKDTAGGNAIQPPNGFGSAGATCDGSHYGGGGGGAGATPSFGANTIGCPGGDGKAYRISGMLTYYAGGGGGGARGSSDSASSGSTAGGLGGGGRGGRGYSGTPTYLPDPGVNGLGGGGGGGGNNSDNGANGGSGIVVVRYPYVSDADALLIHNLPVSDLTGSSATFNGMLMNTGSSATAVSVLWGTTDGGTEWETWANTNWFNDGYPNPAWTNNTPFSTNITLNPGTSYFYTFGASNATTHVVAPSTIGFTTPVLSTVTNLGAVARRTAQLKGRVLDTGGDTPTCWFAWWEAGSATTNTVFMGLQSDVFSTKLTELAGDTTYGFVVVASNNAGVATSATRSFTTLSSGPITWYAATNGIENGIWTNWATAGTNLQTILDVAADGDTILLAGHTFWLTQQIAWTTAGLTIRGGYEADPGGASPGNHDPEQWPTVLARSGTGGNHRVMYIDNADNSTLEYVTLTGGNVWHGGGLRIDNSENVLLSGCIIEDNGFVEGAHANRDAPGIYSVSSSLTLTNCIVRRNSGLNRNNNSSAVVYGGGIWSDKNLTVYDSQIINNSAYGRGNSPGGARGGGIYFIGDHMQLVNVLIAGNEVACSANTGELLNIHGDGLFIGGGGTVELTNCSLVNNGRHGIYRSSGTVTVTNSIFWGNEFDTVGDVTVTSALLDTNPRFEYGYYLADGSPAVNAGNATAKSLGLADYAKNIHGDTYADPEMVNLGYHYKTAFDMQYPDIYVAPDGNDGNAGTGASSPLGTLAKALTLAHAGTRIHVATGHYAIATTGEQFPLTLPDEPGIQIMGTDATQTVFDAVGSGTRVMAMKHSHWAELRQITLRGGEIWHGGGLRIDNSRGVVLAGCIIEDNGGYDLQTAANRSAPGIYAASSALTLTNCIVRGNNGKNRQNSSSAVVHGGGIYCLNGVLTVRDSEIVNNRIAARGNSAGSARGGGVYFSGRILDFKNVLIADNEVECSTASGGTQDLSAGGLYIIGTVTAADLENVTIATNSLEGIDSGSTVNVINSILGGHGDSIAGGNVTVSYSLVEGGYAGDAIIDEDPWFVDPDAGNYRLKTRKGRRHHETDNWIHDEVTSPAIDAGTNRDWHADAVDLDGAPRLQRGRYGTAGIVVDLGAYEQTSRSRGALIRLQ